uniref:Y+L amino acid transporter 2-like n=1 Tax=Ciona intestinalis TaxID=7719 RepID=UPI00089DADE3|nr:Y+L amino acid transporter 2-like [Ciona intestinalis]XP_026696183.1 Y+L amino acid transporter 2-like [Ciona intestinalis]|eukprot:XP_002121410.4 Y+L amino acid transporter 2-like [Ciona intestinalis]
MASVRYKKLENVSDDEEIHVLTDASKSPSNDDKSIKLKRTVGVLDGASIVVGSMIGSGIFIVPTGILGYCNGDMTMSIIIWIIGGIISMLMALCYCELATLLPESGGTAAYLKAAYGDAVCFVYLWILLVSATPQGSAVQVIALGDYISNAIKVLTGQCGSESKLQSKLIGCSIMFLLLVCNMTRVKFALKIQVWCTVGKVAALVLISTMGLIMLISDSSLFVANFQHSLSSSIVYSSKTLNISNDVSVLNTLYASVHTAPDIANFSLAIFQALWAYDGFDNLTYITEEVKKPKKTLPKIIILSVLFVMGLYVAVNLSYFAVLSEKEMLGSNAVAVSFAAKIHPLLTYAVTTGVCLSLIGSINVGFLTVGRMPFVAARMGFMPEVLSMIHINCFSPVPALLFLTALTSLMLIPSNIDILLKAVIFTLWAFRSGCALGVLILRWKMKDVKRPYKVYKVTAVLATVFGFYCVLVPLLFRPQILYGLSIILAVTFYLIFCLLQRGYVQMTGVGKISIFVQKLLMVTATSDEKKIS